MSDRYLLRILEAADAGQPVPWLRVFTPGLIVSGYPAAQREFADAFEVADAVHLYSANMPEKKRRRSSDEAEDERAWQEARDKAATRAKPVHGAASEPPDALCMTEAEGILPDGTRLAFDCIRIPFASISAWTTGQQEILEKPSSGASGWFAGGGFSIPTD